MKRAIYIIAAMLMLCSCGIYSFSGTSIQPDVQTVSIEYFEYKALKVNPSFSNDITEALRNQFRRMTRLEQVDEDGDLEISGVVSGYAVSAQAITAQETASKNRLTVTVLVSFTNNKHPEEDFTDKSFSAYAEFDANTILDAVESTLCAEIIEKINEDIFNATVAQW